MYAELLARYYCKGSLAHVAAGGERMRLLEIGYYRGTSVDAWMEVFPGANVDGAPLPLRPPLSLSDYVQ